MTHTWVSITLTALLVVGVIGFWLGCLVYGELAHRCHRQQPREPDNELRTSPKLPRWESERIPTPVVNVYLTAPPSYVFNAPRAPRVIESEVIPGLPEGWS